MKLSPAKAKAITKKLGVTSEELESAAHGILEAKKKIKRVEEEAKLSIEDLRRTYKEIHEGERMAEKAKAELVERFERHYLSRLLQETGGNVAEVARRAGVDRGTVFRAMRRIGMREEE
jgi:transcriptional regulator of acetoin/glycerol metabolism